MPNRLVNRVRLRDGRCLGFAEVGDARGRPVFYCHGFPGSRLEAVASDGDAARLGLRVIAADRPGFGLSDHKPGRTFLDWPDDLAELADALGIERFIVLGVSGGGPYALACAHRIPQRLAAVGIVSGLAPLRAPGATRGMRHLTRFGLHLSRWAAPLARSVYSLVAPRMVTRRQFLLRRMAAMLPAPDGQAVSRTRLGPIVLDSFCEGLRNGPQGAARDLTLFGRPWGFRLGDVALPVRLWHGEVDDIVPVGMGRHVAEALPDCRPTYYPNEGHFSIIANHLADILGTLAAEA